MTNRVPVIPTERSDEESPFQHIFPFFFLLSPFYFEFSPDVEMTMFIPLTAVRSSPYRGAIVCSYKVPSLSHYVTVPLRQGRSLVCAAWVAVSDCCQCARFNL